MLGRNPNSKALHCLIATATLVLLALGGCSSSTPSKAQQVAMANTELHFNLAACQQIDYGLYKCPAADKPICNPDYNGQAECVRVGPKGSVFVQSGF
jgi:predicted component of type VI protein secretion system